MHCHGKIALNISISKYKQRLNNRCKMSFSGRNYNVADSVHWPIDRLKRGDVAISTNKKLLINIIIIIIDRDRRFLIK